MHRLLSAANRLSGINKSNSSTHSYVFVFLFLAIGLFISIFAFPQTSYANTITVSGLVSNNSTISVTQNNTRLIQAALDKASSEGGGKVIIPAGKYYLDRRGTNLEDCQYNNGRYCLIARDNVLLTGSTTRASDTVLCPIIRENIPGDPNHDQDKKWGLDCFFFDGIRKFNGETRELVDNADFQNFTVDGRYAAIADGADYHASGKGFFFKGFKNCDWENVQVLNTDGTGFGVDFPINCTIKNCYAEKCGKACLLSGSGLGGASGFGIGVGWKDNESMIIENCTSVENANFGFFFEHQCRFDPLVTAKTSNKFQVKNSVAYGNLHNFGGNRTMDTYYYNCTSKIDPDSEFEERTHDAFLFDNYSVRSNFVNCSLQQSPTDISSLTSSQKTALNWAMKEGIVSMGGLGNYDVFRPNDQVYPMEYMTLLYRAFDLGQENVLFVLEPWQGGNVRNTVEAETGPIPSDVDLDAYYGPAYRWAKLAGCDLDNCKVDVFWNGNGQKIASWLQTLLKNTKYKSYFKSTNPTQISQYNSNSLPTTRIGIIEAMYAMIKNMTPAAPTLKTTPVPNSEDTGTITVTSSYVNSPLGTPDNISSMPFTLGFYLNGTSLEYQCSYTPGSSLTTPNLPKGTYTVRAISTAGCGYSLASSSVRILSEGSNASCSLRLTVLSGTVNFNAKCNGSGVGAGTYTIQRSSNSEYVGQINFPASGTIAESMYPDNYKLVPTSVSLPYIDTNTYPFTVSNGTITNVNVVVTTPLDLTRFQAAVSQAEQLLSSVVVSDTGNGLSQGQQYVSSSDEQDLRDAIEIAREAVGKATGQAQVESATTALNNAISTFRTRIQIASGPLDLTQFNDALIRANSLLSTTVSVDGTDLPAGQQYATQSMIDDLNAAINMARTASSSFADQDAVDNATEALSSAIIRFTSDLRTSTGPVSMGSLSDAMDTAQSLLDTTPVSSDGKDLTKGQKYVTPQTANELRSVLEDAVSKYPSIELQSDADNLKTKLESAIRKFRSNLKTAPGAIDLSLFQSSINEANNLLSQTAVSKDGTNITRGRKYVTQTVSTALKNAVNKAKTDMSKATTQTQVNTINKTLRTEIQKFKNSIKSASGPIATNNLQAAINQANQLLKTIKTSSNASSLKKGTKYVSPAVATNLRDAVNKANTVLQNPKSQTNVDKATSDLQKVISSFNISVRTANGGFIDVQSGAWYEDAIQWANDNNLLTGYKGTNKFGPNDRLTRAQAALILWRYYEPSAAQKYVDSQGKNTTPFKDNLNGAYYTAAINWAYKNKIFTGYTGTNLVGVDDQLTREQLCIVIHRCATQISKTTKNYSLTKFNSYPDKGSVSSYAVQQVAWCLDKGVISGMNGTLIAPTAYVDRAQMAQVMKNIVEKKIIK